MKRVNKIEDKELIEELFEEVEYGTLALCTDNKPYSLPINFVKVKNEIFFHGAKKGKKIDIINENPNVSFSVVDPI